MKSVHLTKEEFAESDFVTLGYVGYKIGMNTPSVSLREELYHMPKEILLSCIPIWIDLLEQHKANIEYAQAMEE